MLLLMVAVTAARTSQVATEDTARGLVPSGREDRDAPPSAKLGNETTLVAFADGQLAARNNLWKRKIFLVLGQSNANGRANAARLTEDDRRRLAKVADRVILTYRGDMSWGLSGAQLKPQHDPGRCYQSSGTQEEPHRAALPLRRLSGEAQAHLRPCHITCRPCERSCRACAVGAPSSVGASTLGGGGWLRSFMISCRSVRHHLESPCSLPSGCGRSRYRRMVPAAQPSTYS